MEVSSPPAASHTPSSSCPEPPAASRSSPDRFLQDKHNNNSDNFSKHFSNMTSDIEQFQGKIVYNPDGSAYIIEDAEFSDEEELDLPTQEGSIVEKAGGESTDVDQFPTIENAVYVSRTKSQYPSYVRAQTSAPDRPTVHSYRVYNYRHKSSDKLAADLPDTGAGGTENVPVKPILMCFICKLSFGNTKSFKNHCMDEHSIEFNDEELDNLKTENISALVQPVGKDKSPLLSFLQPVTKSQNSLPLDQVPRIQSPSKSPGEGGIRVRNDLAAQIIQQSQQQVSPVSNGGRDCGRDTESPVEGSMSPSPNSFSQMMSVGGNSPFASSLKGTTIGACPEHIQGRPTGVECAKCDLILNSNRLGSVQQAWNASNNACKTLKCPKCNWHYKYQETLEIHMKEKHPDSETTCIYCITGQQHPRLARGETYTCGYKPYRCEVCNYSTTTKGNLSIHMQSDKHINNMQEIQNNGGEAPTSPSPSQTSNKYATPCSTPKPQDLDKEANKPNWRCDICNYETNIARNLRIHMTSEKHMNNIMNLQGLPNLEGGNGPAGANLPMPNFPNLPNVSAGGPAAGLQQLLGGMPMLPGAGLPGSPMKEAAMADMAFNQALLMQMMGAGGQGLPGLPGIPFLPPGGGPPGPPGSMGEGGPDQMDMDQADPNPRLLYNCAVCREFSCDHLQALSEHLSIDRTKQRESEVSLLIGGTYICKLCSYKTNLKANFQLHCKTDKHLQKLQLVNHIMEGGPANEWKLNFMNVSNSVQLRCNACDFYTDSIHKLQIHTANQGHEVSQAIFNHLRKIESEESVEEGEKLLFSCTLCQHSTPGKGLLLQHCRSVKHLQMEQLHLLQRRAEGAASQPDISDIFTVSKTGADEKLKSEDKDERSEKEVHNVSRDESMDTDDDTNNPHQTTNNNDDEGSVRCPLCQEGFPDKETLEDHAMSIHSINGEGLARLMMLMQGSHWLNSNKNSKDDDENSECGSGKQTTHQQDRNVGGERARSPTAQMDKYTDPARPYKCDVCRESFTQKSILLVHYNSVGHLRSLKRKMQDSAAGGGDNNDNLNTSESDLDKSQSSDTAASPKKEETANPALNDIQNAMQAMLAARLQLLNPMLRGQMPPGGMNPMAMMGGLPFGPGGPAGMAGLNPLHQLAMAQQMAGGSPRMPDPAQLLSQLAASSGKAPLTPEKQPQELKLSFPNASPVPPMNLTPQSHQAAMDQYGEQKRARTKITEDQLKVLRSHFDISNSPSDEQITMMAQQTGLPPKVIKHWFRNTLFKERQKNKDSPYNFNNPPSTVINLEEYEKTGEPKVQALYPEVELNEEPDEKTAKDLSTSVDSRTDKHHIEEIISDDEREDGRKTEDLIISGSHGMPGTSIPSSLPPNLTLSSILSSQTMADSLLSNYPPQLSNPFRQSTENNTFSQMLHNLAANSSSLSEPSSPGSGQRLSPGQDMSSIHGKRANRTRFSDYQVKVLQEFFEKNAYPKDDDLEYLSKLLGLTPRVIVVWFQNARQKARKAYENQPSAEVVADELEGRFTRTPSLSYQCKKCNLEFQRYYELIRHQKQHCYKEEDAKRSALAQKAAAHAAATLSTQGGTQMLSHSEDSNSSFSERNITSPVFNQSMMSWKRKPSMDEMHEIEEPRSKLPKTTNLFPPLVPPAAGQPVPGSGGNDLEASMRKFYEDTMKRYMDELSVRPASQQNDGQALDLRSSSADLDHGSNRSENDNDSDSWDKSGGEDSSSEQPRGGMYVDGSDFDGEAGENSGMSGAYLDANGQRDANNKRFRTHMSNVQVKMMKSVFEGYKTPTMPECLGLGNQIGLQKRVVQVWFQNARAKEKKAKLYLQQITGQEPEMPPAPRGCRWCNFEYPANYSVQEHIFLPKHLENVRIAIEQGLYDPESPGATLTQQAESLQNGGNPYPPRPAGTPPRVGGGGQDGGASNTDSSPSPSKPNLGPGLSMMMAAGGLHSPGRPDLPDSRMLMPPFYGMGQGLNSYPIGVTNTVHNV